MGRDIKYNIHATDKTKQGVASAQNNLRGLQGSLGKTSQAGIKGFGNLSSLLSVGLAGAFAGATKMALDFGAASYQAFQENERIALRLSASMRAAGTDFGRMNDFLEELAGQSLATGTELNALAAQFSQLGRSQEEIEKILEAAVSYSNATGKGINEVATQLSKTLSGTAGEIGELLPEMRGLTAEQLKQGEGLDLVIDKLGTYNELMEESSSQITKNYEDSLDNLHTAFGRFVSGPINALKQRMAEINNALADFFNKLYSNEAPTIEVEIDSARSELARLQEDLDRLTARAEEGSSQWAEIWDAWGGNDPNRQISDEDLKAEIELALGPMSRYNTQGDNSELRRQIAAMEENIAAQQQIIAELEAQKAAQDQNIPEATGGPATDVVSAYRESFTDFYARINELFTQAQQQEEIRTRLIEQGVEDSGIIAAEYIRAGLSSSEINIADSDFFRLMDNAQNATNQEWKELSQTIFDYFVELQYLTEAQREYFESEPVDYTGPGYSTGANFGDTSYIGEMMGGEAGILQEVMGSLGDFGGSLLTAIQSVDSVMAVMDPLSVIIAGALDVLSPLIDSVLQPVIGALTIVGHVVGKLLTPGMQMLGAIIEALVPVFVWLHNKVLMPFGNALIWLIGSIMNFFIGAANGVIKLLNAIPGVNIAGIKKVDIKGSQIEEISVEDVSAAGASSNAYSGGSGGTAAQYTGGRNYTVNVAVYTDVLTGDNGFDQLALRLRDAIERQTALGF